MSDSDDLDLDGGDDSDAGGSSSKKRGGGGLGNLLPNILKFVAIGLGALVFIVTISVITFNIMNKGGKNQTIISDPSSPYVGKRPEFAYYDMLGSITVKTSDFPVSSNVTVEMVIGYDVGDTAANTELISRKFEMLDFIRRYFSGKSAKDLTPDKEEALKYEIREQLNTRLLDTARVRTVLFKKLDVMENF